MPKMHLRGHAVSANALHSRLLCGWTQARVEQAVDSIGNLMLTSVQANKISYMQTLSASVQSCKPNSSMFMVEGLDGTSFHWEQYVERQQAFVDRLCQTYISPRSSTHVQ